MKNETKPSMMTIKQIAKTGLMPENALRQLLKEGKLPVVYIGKKALVNYSVVLQGGALMRSILEELWYGNVCPNTGCREATKEAKELMGYIADHHDNLQATLTDKQKEILEKFDDCYAELTDINEREIFVYAFRLRARIAIDVMSLDIE